MSGHSAWANIKHKKQANDAKRGKIFSKIAKEMMIAVRANGKDPITNLTLRTLLQKARAANMPSDNIERAIKRGAGEVEGEVFDEVMYEGYAPGGIGLIVQVLTSNRNRAAAEVRHTFTRFGGNLGGQNSVLRTFQRKGVILVEEAAASEEKLMEVALEAGAGDLIHDADAKQFEITTDPAQFGAVVDALAKANIATQSAEISLVADLMVPVTEAGAAKKIVDFMEALEDIDDVQNVYSNADIDPKLVEG
ncbi:MAG: YebC/PmpR family DNA-binding transcriptional regulator [Verrucomicrobia bacterium]|nr:MAG: YebC/PmpR family DNA-binding transcriptional regulator [Verrucomicrobiota bacterium]